MNIKLIHEVGEEINALPESQDLKDKWQQLQNSLAEPSPSMKSGRYKDGWVAHFINEKSYLDFLKWSEYYNQTYNQ